jgi:hypothetical protein
MRDGRFIAPFVRDLWQKGPLPDNVAIRAGDILRAITGEHPDHLATGQRLPAAIRTDPR